MKSLAQILNRFLNARTSPAGRHAVWVDDDGLVLRCKSTRRLSELLPKNCDCTVCQAGLSHNNDNSTREGEGLYRFECPGSIFEAKYGMLV